MTDRSEYRADTVVVSVRPIISAKVNVVNISGD